MDAPDGGITAVFSTGTSVVAQHGDRSHAQPLGAALSHGARVLVVAGDAVFRRRGLSARDDVAGVGRAVLPVVAFDGPATAAGAAAAAGRAAACMHGCGRGRRAPRDD